jgi:cytochrome c55X
VLSLLGLSAKNVTTRETGAAITASVSAALRKLGHVGFVLSLGVFFSISDAAFGAGTDPSSVRQTELIKLVRNDCGSCHGIRLTGGLGLPLTPQALKGKPAKSLVTTILFGRPGTPMPPWNTFMTEAEAAWIVENLLQGFPDVR